MLGSLQKALLAGFILTGTAADALNAWAADAVSPVDEPAMTSDRLELGRRMYMEGILPSGEMMSATILGDIRISGKQVICGTCHRRSGMGSSEGPQVIPALTEALLYNPLRIPTSKPPLAPLLRPAYTDESLRQAIRAGIDAGGEALDPLMPRYSLTDREIEILIDYTKTLSPTHSPGVTDREMHFATIVADSVPAATRQAMLDVMQTFFKQKNSETRYESKRAAKAPWHKAWIFKPYRKWVLHVWELSGPVETWSAQLHAQYKKQPVFALLSGVVNGSWRPIHEFCQAEKIPSLFPITDLPVIAEDDFYSLYLSKGMTLDGEAVASHLLHEGAKGKPIVQAYLKNDIRARTAAASLQRESNKRELQITTVQLESASPPHSVLQEIFDQSEEGTLILWLNAADLQGIWSSIDLAQGPDRIYLSSKLFAGDVSALPLALRDNVYFVHSHELPGRLSRLLIRSTGWLRAKRIYAPDERQVQANTYFALKIAGSATRHIRGYFFRDYFVERIEHLVDNATYTSIFPRVSLAPGQRFVAKGSYIVKVSGETKEDLQAVAGWKIP